MGWFILLLIGVPLLDTWLLINVGTQIGALYTIGLVILTAVVGGNLVKRQGLSTWMKIQQQMQSGQAPAIELFEGGCILVAGALLITPGFLTDTIGFLLLVPPLRQVVAAWWLKRKLAKAETHFIHNPNHHGQTADPFEQIRRRQAPSGSQRSPSGGGDVIDTDGHIIDDEP